MSLAAGTQWNYRPSGNNNNGGGFVSGGSGTNYSLQDAAQLAFTDLEVKNGDYDRIYSTTHDASLTAAMVDNIIQITGDGGSGLFTAGYYHVTGNGNDGSNYLDIDRVCATGNASDGVANLGGALAVPIDSFLDGVPVNGNTIHMMSGTYTLTEHIAVIADASYDGARIIEGYKTTQGDTPRGTDRPLITGVSGNYQWRITGNYWQCKNLRVALDEAVYGWETGDYGFVVNCYCRNQTATASKYAFRAIADHVVYIDCEGISDNGQAFYNTGFADTQYMQCYAHDSVDGFRVASAQYHTLWQCIADTCSGMGFYVGHSRCVNCNAYNCGTGFSTVQGGGMIYNCQVSDCTTGIAGTWPNMSGVFIDANNYYNNTADVSNVTKGPNATANNPGYTNPAAGDFSDVDNQDGIGMRLAVG